MNNSRLVLHEIHQKVRYITKEFNERLKQYELYSSQWSILLCLMKNGPLTQSDIAKYLSVEAPTVTRTINRLEQSMWVVRKSGEDQREKIVLLSDKGLEKLPELEMTVQQFEHEMTQQLSEDEYHLLLNLLKKIGN